MMRTELLAAERTRASIETAERMRYTRKLRTLRRALRIERRAERRMIAAWRRTAELRGAIEPAEY